MQHYLVIIIVQTPLLSDSSRLAFWPPDFLLETRNRSTRTAPTELEFSKGLG